MFCKCGSSKIENRELKLCASCNRVRRAADTVAVIRERKPLAQVSAVRSEMLKGRKVAYAEVKQEQPQHCAACGSKRRLTPSHVLTQKQFPAHALNPDNIVVLCQDCHNTWEHDKQDFRLTFPDVWALKLTIMQALEPAFYQQFVEKHEI